MRNIKLHFNGAPSCDNQSHIGCLMMQMKAEKERS